MSAIHFPNLNFGLGETADMIRDTVVSFAEAELAPRAAEIDETNEFPMDMWEKWDHWACLGSR